MELFAIVFGIGLILSLVMAFVVVNRLITHKEAQVRRQHGFANEKE